MWKIIAHAPKAIKSFNLKSKYCNIIKTSDFIKRKKKERRENLFWIRVKKIVCVNFCVRH